ncbi:MAG TPA: hypothetical protein VFH29_01165 [Anaerolineales bacterium]|nr:hypothetical protein [Anaerolineales bacterium]
MAEFGASQSRAVDTVECRSDSEYAERPLALTWQGQRMEIAEIVATWRGPGEKGFRIKTAAGAAFDLAYREITDEWLVQPL